MRDFRARPPTLWGVFKPTLRPLLLALATLPLAACALLFSDGSGGGSPSGDGGTLPPGEGGTADAGATVIDCKTAGDCPASTMTTKDFPHTGFGGNYAVDNVALAHFQAEMYAMVQGKTYLGDVESNRGQTSWGKWGVDKSPPTDAVSGWTQLCGDNPSCLSPLHLVATAQYVTAVYANPDKEQDCVAGLLSRSLAGTSPGTDACIGVGGAWNDARAVHTDNRGIAYLSTEKLWVEGGTATSDDQFFDADGAAGFWAGELQGKMRAVYTSAGDKLLHAVDISGGARPTALALGAGMAFPDVATAAAGAYIGGVSTADVQAGNATFMLEFRALSGLDLGMRPAEADSVIDLSGLKIKPPLHNAANAANAARRPYQPLLVRQSEDALRLIALSQRADDGCELLAFVQTKARGNTWEKHTLLPSGECSKVSFDAAVDNKGALHVLFGTGKAGTGQAAEPVGYRVITR